MSAIETEETIESVESFRSRARAWITENLAPLDPFRRLGYLRGGLSDEEELADLARDRVLQRKFLDAGFAGVCVPREYGGQGLTPEHQRALNEEIVGYEYPMRMQTPTMSPCAEVLLDFATEEQKRRHIPAILRGEAIWVQMLSEPSGGSDVAGALTTAVRDGDEWVLNGSKIWTSGAWWADWALCLARTNWDVPKHRGLTVFMVPIDAPGIEIHRIEMLNGNREFCQEFLTDVRIPDANRVGEIDGGWTVGVGWMFHERMGMAQSTPLMTRPAIGGFGPTDARILLDVARDAGRGDDPYARDLVGEAHMLRLVSAQLQRRVADGIATGAMSDQAASIARLFSGVVLARNITVAYELAGAASAAWSDDDGAAVRRGVDFLTRQSNSIAGGTLEMARNVISERVLGMPREQSLDRDRPFRDVPRGPSAHG
jgi:alkylation response protein AidB-like acyl-CoA dehydrogenase